MKRALIAVFLLLSLCALAQQPSATVEITAEPHHHLVIENLFVHAYAVNVAPKETSLMHHHGRDYLSISLGDAEIINAKEGAAPVNAKFKDGDVRFTPAGLVHAVTNTADQPFRNATIELMQPTTNQHACTEGCSVPVPCDAADKTKCTMVTKAFQSDQWSVTIVTMPAGASYAQHTHLANYLVFSLSDGDVKVRVQDGPETAVHYKRGDLIWNNPTVHSLSNTGASTVRAAVLEFRGRPAGEGSESMGPDTKPKPHDHH
ncbi:MAG: hypothetical protein LAO20_11925 [Acidobacteriia bacterium]|nr:hypothetical protein [Terriglobia bacterium]